MEHLSDRGEFSVISEVGKMCPKGFLTHAFQFSKLAQSPNNGIQGFRKHTTDNTEISDIFVNFVFQSGGDY